MKTLFQLYKYVSDSLYLLVISKPAQFYKASQVYSLKSKQARWHPSVWWRDGERRPFFYLLNFGIITETCIWLWRAAFLRVADHRRCWVLHYWVSASRRIDLYSDKCNIIYSNQSSNKKLNRDPHLKAMWCSCSWTADGESLKLHTVGAANRSSQFTTWNHFLFVVLFSSIILKVISLIVLKSQTTRKLLFFLKLLFQKGFRWWVEDGGCVLWDV